MRLFYMPLALALALAAACTHPRFQSSKLSAEEVAQNGCDGKPAKIVSPAPTTTDTVSTGGAVFTFDIKRHSYGMLDTPQGDYWLGVEISNSGARAIEIDWNKASITLPGGTSYKAYIEDTPKEEKDRVQQVMTVPPKGNVRVWLYPSGLIWPNAITGEGWQYGMLYLDDSVGKKLSFYIPIVKTDSPSIDLEICKH